MTITEQIERPRRTMRAIVLPAVWAAVAMTSSGTPTFAFERAAQVDYDHLAFCYGQQVGAANALADDHDHWRAAYSQPDAETAHAIGMVEAHAVELSTLADTTAALYEDLDHPGYEMDPISTNEAYFKGYQFWEGYMAVPFDRRAVLELTEEMMGMSPDCWRTIFALEAINATNIAAGELVWLD